MAIVKKIIGGKIELIINKVYANIPALQKLIFIGVVNNLEKFKKYISQGENIKIKSIKIKNLNTKPLRPVYYTSEIPKTRVIINS